MPTIDTERMNFEQQDEDVPMAPDVDFLKAYLMPKYIMPQLLNDLPVGPFKPDHTWLNREIARLSEEENYEDDEPMNIYDSEAPSWIHSQQEYQPMNYATMLEEPNNRYDVPLSSGKRVEAPPTNNEHKHDVLINPDGTEVITEPYVFGTTNEARKTDVLAMTSEAGENVIFAMTPDGSKDDVFAMTPGENGFYDKFLLNDQAQQNDEAILRKIIMEPPRHTRQNPNMNRQKTLVASNVERFRTALANKDLRIPVSLLPINMRWLRVNDKMSSPDDMISTEKPRNIPAIENVQPEEAIYGVVLIASVVSTLVIIIVGFGFGWYTLSKKAKAAADVDYPAYGVTGPNVDTSGDRKLAHSAHMYHYQHQKQQIIAMERNGMEQRSLSDPESEEENEEGDYTVYECPGFATTGEMEVKNPLFSDEPTPATPIIGKVEEPKPEE